MRSPPASLILDLPGAELTPEDKEILTHPFVAGVILFSRNYTAPAQLKNLCQAIQATRKMPLTIMVDQEGGRVQRFREGFTRLPAMASFGELYDTDPLTACQSAQETAYVMASELLALGVNRSLAPVLDLNKGVSAAIGDRAFHRDPQVVVNLAKSYIAGMTSAGMAPVAKHFPGHGSVVADSHIALPADDRSWQEIANEDLLPFVSLIQEKIPAMMAAHIVFPQIDAHPVGFSRHWLQTILRKKLGFKGHIFSDDLNMEGANISTHFVDRVNAAQEAGCDFVLLCNNRPAVIQVLNTR